MRPHEALLRDLSLLLELTLVPNEQPSLEQFTEQFVDRLLARTFAYNAVFFVESTMTDEEHSESPERRESLLGLPSRDERPSGARFFALPKKRAQYLVGSSAIDAEASGIRALLGKGGSRVLPGAESVLARVAFPGVEPPDWVLQVAVGDVGVLEMYGGASGLLDEHLGRVLSTLSEWLAGQVKCFSAQSRDRERLAQAEASEAWIGRLFDELPGVIWRADIHGHVTYLSSQAGPLLGLDGATTWAELRRGIHPDDKSRVEQSIAAAIAARRPSVSLRYRHRRGTEDVLEVDERILFGFLPDGGLILKAGYVDVSPRSSDGFSTRSSLSQPRFMDRLSHELRSPLFPVIALSDLLLQLDPSTVSAEDWQRHLQMINQSGKALLELVSDLLELSRIEVQRTRLDAGPVDLRHVVRDLGARFSGPESKLEILLENEGEAGTTYTDRSTLDRVLQALATSVRNLAGERGGRIVLGARSDALWIRALVREVTLPPNLVQEWFEPFPALPREARESSVGDGLSMTLVKELSLALGGHCEARATNEGLEVEITLPARRAELTRALPLAGRVVLVAIRDLPTLFRVTLEILASGGEARQAREVELAEQLARNEAVDTVIATIQLEARGRLLAAAHHVDRPRPARCFLFDEVSRSPPEGFESVIRPSGGGAAVREALSSEPSHPRRART